MQLTYEGGGWDRNGGLYRGEDNQLYRIIAPHMRNFYQAVIGNPEVRALIAEGKLIPFHVTRDLGQSGTLTLRHDIIPSPTYPFEWTQEMFFRAAELTIEVCRRLVGQGMCLQDASFWNILFVGRRPTFVDFTSIVPLTDEDFDQFVAEFRSAILSSLSLIRDGHITLLRRVSRDYGKSISADVASHIVPRTIHGQSRFRNSVNEFIAMPSLVAARKLSRRCASFAERRAWPNRTTREKRLRQLSEAIGRSAVGYGSSRWGSYYSGANGLPSYDGTLVSLQAMLTSNSKHQAVAETIDKIAPSRYVDLGCNRGLYAHYASSRGATSIGLDVDEEALDLMFADGDALSSQAIPCFADVTAPATPVGPPGKKWPALGERCRGDLASCLALAHHLLLGSPRITATALAAMLSDFTTDWLILEFVHPTDPFLLEAYGTPPATYNAEQLLAELKPFFVVTERLPSSMPSREILVCRRR